jgi:hypothetical protein
MAQSSRRIGTARRNRPTRSGPFTPWFIVSRFERLEEHRQKVAGPRRSAHFNLGRLVQANLGE